MLTHTICQHVFLQVDKGCRDCHKHEKGIKIGDQVVTNRVVDPWHIACAFKARQLAIKEINAKADKSLSESSSAKAQRREGAKRFADATPEERGVSRGEELDFDL